MTYLQLLPLVHTPVHWLVGEHIPVMITMMMMMVVMIVMTMVIMIIVMMVLVGEDVPKKLPIDGVIGGRGPVEVQRCRKGRDL